MSKPGLRARTPHSSLRRARGYLPHCPPPALLRLRSGLHPEPLNCWSPGRAARNST
ncbi:MAG: hypothetical protein OJF62_000157 [Pseudolabrys sp.]|nr:hypothetical protein [Pseudolabrys sp.]